MKIGLARNTSGALKLRHRRVARHPCRRIMAPDRAWREASWLRRHLQREARNKLVLENQNISFWPLAAVCAVLLSHWRSR